MLYSEFEPNFAAVVNTVVVISLTDCRYFIPSFTELTTSDLAENKRRLAESGISFPIGTYFRVCCYSQMGQRCGKWAGRPGGHRLCMFFLCVRVSLCWCCAEIGTLIALCFLATVCKPSLAHCNGHGIPLQADREEVVAWHADSRPLSLFRLLSISSSVGRILPFA